MAWQLNTTGPVTGSVAVVNGTVYGGDWAGFLYAVNASTGSLEWRTSLGGDYDYTECGFAGIAATPALWNGTVYIGGSNPSFYAVNASTGKVLWSIDLGNVTGDPSPWWASKLWSSALIYDGYAYVGLASGCDNPLVRAGLFQISLSTHAISHIFYTVPAGQVGASIWSSPSVDPSTHTIWVTTGNEGNASQIYARAVIALNASNVSRLVGYAQEALPGYDLDFGDGATLFQDSHGVPMVAAVNKNGVAYAFNDSGVLANGSSTPRWTLTLSDSWGANFVPPAFSGDMLYFGANNTTLPNGTTFLGGVWAVYPDNGTVAWTVGLTGGIYAGVTYANGLIYVGENGGASGNLVVLDAATGRILYDRVTWKIYGEPVVLNGMVVFTTGDLFADDNGSIAALVTPVGTTMESEGVMGLPVTTYAFQARPTGGEPPYSVKWTYDGVPAGGGANCTVGFSTAGEHVVGVEVVDYRGTGDFQNITLMANAPLHVTGETAPSPSQVPVPTWLNLTVTGGAPPYSISWFGLPPGALPANTSSQSVSFLPSIPGSWNVSAKVVAASGQATSFSFPPLVVNPRPVFSWSSPQGVTVLAGLGAVALALGSVGVRVVLVTRRRAPPS